MLGFSSIPYEAIVGCETTNKPMRLHLRRVQGGCGIRVQRTRVQGTVPSASACFLISSAFSFTACERALLWLKVRSRLALRQSPVHVGDSHPRLGHAFGKTLSRGWAMTSLLSSYLNSLLA